MTVIMSPDRLYPFAISLGTPREDCHQFRGAKANNMKGKGHVQVHVRFRLHLSTDSTKLPGSARKMQGAVHYDDDAVENHQQYTNRRSLRGKSVDYARNGD